MTLKSLLPALLLVCSQLAIAQVGKTKNVGTAVEISQSIQQAVAGNPAIPNTGSKYQLPTPSGALLQGNVNRKTIINGKVKIVGGEGKNGSFQMSVDADGNVSGLYTNIAERKAFRYATDGAGNVITKEVAIESVLCMDYKAAPEPAATSAIPPTNKQMAIPSFSSKPNSKYVIYIDLDGETSTSDWNNGNTIYAQPLQNWTDAEVKELWTVAAMDYYMWDVNVTTDRSVYDATPECRRKMCIITSTNNAGPSGIGGIAYIDTFDDCSGNPCWVFNKGAKTAGETVSHEVGHTVGLDHDGKGSTVYYQGHNNWAPIMGAVYSTSTIKIDGPNTVGQWSKGEYSGATNGQDDIAIIGSHNSFGQEKDDAGNTTATAKDLVVETDGKVLNTKNAGLINNRSDLDVFKFVTTSAGDLTLTIDPYSLNPDLAQYPDLNIKARLLNSSGTAVVTADPTGTTYASMSATVSAPALAAGTYYLEIDGVGNATASDGYTDYHSVGPYYISGSIAPPSNKPIPLFTASITKICAGAQVTITDQSSNGAGNWQWTFPGGTPASSTQQNPVVTYNTAGTYDVKLVVENSNGKDSITKSNYITVITSPPAPQAPGVSRCGPGVVNLSATGNGGTLEWYDATNGGTLLATGSTYSPNLTGTTTYYVSESGGAASQKVGPVDNSLNAGGFFNTNDTRGLLFDVLGACILKSVKVYAQGAGDRTIEVRQSVGGAVLHTKTVNIPDGESRVTLDFPLQPGTQYHIKVSGSLIDLYRNNGGATYPYTLANLISITETDAAADGNTNFYYYFYDWEIATQGCPSPRTAVVGKVNDLPPVPTVSQVGGTVISSSPSGNQWYFNGTAITGATDQSYVTPQNGDYTVKVTSPEGCTSESAVSNMTASGIEDLSNPYLLSIYPNPSNGLFSVTFNAPQRSNYKLEIRNAIGQLVQQENINSFSGVYSQQLNIAQYGKGVYTIRISAADNETAVKKVIVF